MLEETRTRFRRGLPDDPEEFRATLVQHLEDLRDRVVRIVLLLVAGWVVGWIIQPPAYAALNGMITDNLQLPKGAEYKEAFRSATDPFVLKLKLSFFLGLILTLPFIVMQIWGFIAPGLKVNERRPMQRLAPLSILLFAIGAFFCWMILPSAISWFSSYLGEFPGTSLYQDPGTMAFFVLKMMLAFGIGFQLPLVVYGLGAIGLLSSETLIKYWRQSAVVIFFLSAVLTPSSDAISMLMMAIPLVILFSISVWVVKIVQGKDKTDEASNDQPPDDSKTQ